MISNLRVFLWAALVLVVTHAHGQIMVENNQTVEYYVQNVLLGAGVTASNITFNGIPASLVSPQVGSFDCTNCNVGLPDGFVMASGNCQVVVGPNDGGGTTLDNFNMEGNDPDLNAISTGFGINDWAIIEFDFIPQGDSISFSYVWGSEEYMEWVNSSFNDIFGFFLSGPGFNGPFSNGAVNIALIPGTSLPVTINNVNANLNGQYYVDNGDGFTPPFNTNPYYIQFDGFTVPLLARAAVQCGQTYHIKLACADSGDDAYDCGVFFQAGSFASPVVAEANVIDPPPFLPPNSVLEGCVNGNILFYPPTDLAQDTTVTLTFGGSATNGIDYQPVAQELVLSPGSPTAIPILPVADDVVEGIELLEISYIFENSCGELDTAMASLQIVDYVDMTLSVEDVFICPGTQETAVPDLDNGAPGFSFSWSSGENTNTATYLPGDAGSYSLTVTDYCENTVTAEFEVIEPAPFVPLDTAVVCQLSFAGPLVSGGVKPYIYDFDETGLEIQDAENAFFTGLAIGSYTVIIEDQCGQEVEVPVTVKECDTLIPNIFSPNGDGRNDEFFIEGLEGFPDSSLLVYNRWGALVYESSDYSNGWDGKELSEGTYFYIFKRSDGKSFEGYVQLVK